MPAKVRIVVGDPASPDWPSELTPNDEYVLHVPADVVSEYDKGHDIATAHPGLTLTVRLVTHHGLGGTGDDNGVRKTIDCLVEDIDRVVNPDLDEALRAAGFVPLSEEKERFDWETSWLKR